MAGDWISRRDAQIEIVILQPLQSLVEAAHRQQAVAAKEHDRQIVDEVSAQKCQMRIPFDRGDDIRSQGSSGVRNMTKCTIDETICG